MKNPGGKSHAVSPTHGLAWLLIEDAPHAKAAVLVQPITAGDLYLNPPVSLGSSIAESGPLCMPSWWYGLCKETCEPWMDPRSFADVSDPLSNAAFLFSCLATVQVQVWKRHPHLPSLLSARV